MTSNAELIERLRSHIVLRKGETVMLDMGDGPIPVLMGDTVQVRNPDGEGAASTITALEEERDALRQIIANLGYCTPNASLEFMQMIPAEVRARVTALEERIRVLSEALDRIADVWTLQTRTLPTGRKWHCQHEEWLCAAVETARAALNQSNDDYCGIVVEPKTGRSDTSEEEK